MGKIGHSPCVEYDIHHVSSRTFTTQDIHHTRHLPHNMLWWRSGVVDVLCGKCLLFWKSGVLNVWCECLQSGQSIGSTYIPAAALRNNISEIAIKPKLCKWNHFLFFLKPVTWSPKSISMLNLLTVCSVAAALDSGFVTVLVR